MGLLTISSDSVAKFITTLMLAVVALAGYGVIWCALHSFELRDRQIASRAAVLAAVDELPVVELAAGSMQKLRDWSVSRAPTPERYSVVITETARHQSLTLQRYGCAAIGALGLAIAAMAMREFLRCARLWATLEKSRPG